MVCVSKKHSELILGGGVGGVSWLARADRRPFQASATNDLGGQIRCRAGASITVLCSPITQYPLFLGYTSADDLLLTLLPPTNSIIHHDSMSSGIQKRKASPPPGLK